MEYSFTNRSGRYRVRWGRLKHSMYQEDGRNKDTLFRIENEIVERRIRFKLQCKREATYEEYSIQSSDMR